MNRISLSSDHLAEYSTRIPTPQSALIGRNREMALTTALLRREDVRLLTLTGPGGIGKTRLGIEIATALTSAFPDGIRHVSLAEVPHADLFTTTLARAFKIQEKAGADPFRALLEILTEARLLLVLDNFEHVVSAATILSDLIASCQHFKVLVTSRSPLRITGEHAFPISPLELPDQTEPSNVDQIRTSPAVQLFVERAQAVNPYFVLDETNATAVADICQLLDGLPLSIELAAAQSAILPPSALLSRIESGMPLPIAGPRDAPGRHRTTRDAIAWSYDLLSEEEQRLFRCTGVFVGGFSLDAAETVCGSSGLPDPPPPGPIATGYAGSPPDVLNDLASLVENSLVHQAAWEGDARFSLLETIRGFARDLLVESGEIDAVRDAHAAWCLRFVEERRFAWLLPGGEQHLLRLEIDHSNIVAALEWFSSREDHERLLRFATVLGGFWYAHTHYREGTTWLKRALTLAPDPSTTLWARACVSLGMLLNVQGQTAQAEQFLADGLACLREANDIVTVTLVLVSQGALANFRGDYARADGLLHEALTLQPHIPDAMIAASIKGRIFSNLGVAAQGRGDPDLALTHHERALAIYRQSGNSLGIIRSLCDRGEVSSDLGNYAASLADFQECLAIPGAKDDLRVVVDALEGVALAMSAWNQPVQAARFLGAAQAVRDRVGASAIIEADQLALERVMSAIRAALDDDEQATAWAAGQGLSITEVIAEVHALSPPDDDSSTIDRSGIRLSSREQQVLNLLVEGYSDRAIAEELFLSVRTVEAHVTRIRVKLGVHTRTAAVTAAIVSGLVDPSTRTES